MLRGELPSFIRQVFDPITYDESIANQGVDKEIDAQPYVKQTFSAKITAGHLEIVLSQAVWIGRAKTLHMQRLSVLVKSSAMDQRGMQRHHADSTQRPEQVRGHDQAVEMFSTK